MKLKQAVSIALTSIFSLIIVGCDEIITSSITFNDAYREHTNYLPTSIYAQFDDYDFTITDMEVIEDIYDVINEANYTKLRENEEPYTNLKLTLNYESLDSIYMASNYITYENEYYSCSSKVHNTIYTKVAEYKEKIKETVKTFDFTMGFDYGSFIYGKATLLFDDSIFDVSKYGITNLKSGDVVRIYYTGELYFLETYPSQLCFDNGELKNAEVFRATEVNFTVTQVPGGGYDIISDKGESYILPDYIVYEDNYTSINNVYNNLKLVGTLPYNSTTNKLCGLYAIDYDPSKLDDNSNNDNNHDFVANSESLNNYFEDLIEAMSYTKEGNYHYSMYEKNGSYSNTKHYLIKDGIEYIYFYDNEYNSSLSGYLLELHSEYYAINTGKVKYEQDNYSEVTKESLRKEYYVNEESLIDFYNKNKPLVNEQVYGNYKVYITAIDPCCGGPIYIVFDDITTQEVDDFTIELSTSNLDYKSFFADRYSVSEEEYVANMVEKVSVIDLEGEYSLLSKIENYPNDNYTIEYGFGEYKFYENKYVDVSDTEMMHYSVCSYPDYGFSSGQYITRVYISDKNVTFNGLTLNSTYQEIVDMYKSLGFYYNLENPVYVELTDKTGDIIICISKANSFIDFSIKITNVLRVVY